MKTTCRDCGTAVQRNSPRGVAFELDPSTGRLTHSCPTKDAPMTNDLFTSPTDSLSDMDKVERDRWGRPLIRPEAGGRPLPYQRVTTFIKAMDDTTGLSLWQQRMVARGLAARPDLLLAAQAHGDDDKELNRLCKEALEAAAASSKATIGTAIHRITERLDRGEGFPVPDTVKADVDAYQRATAHITWVHIERMVVHDAYQLAGTPDRIGLVDGRPVVADLKTGSLWPSSCAMQMAVYANSRLYDIATGDRADLDVDRSRALVIHLPAGSGSCELSWVDIAAGYEAVECARKVHAWRKRKDLTSAYQPAGTDDLLGRQIRAAASADDLHALWQQHRDIWTPDHTAAAKQRKQQLTAA